MESDKKFNIIGIFLAAFSILSALSLISYYPGDLAFLTSNPSIRPHNYISFFGAYFSFGLYFMFGWAAYLVPVLSMFWAVNFFTVRKFLKFYVTLVSFAVLFMSLSAFLSILNSTEMTFSFESGGVLGIMLSQLFIKYFGKAGGTIIVIALILMSSLLSTEMMIIPLFISLTKYVFKSVKFVLYSVFTVFKKPLNFFKFSKKEKNAVPRMRTQKIFNEENSTNDNFQEERIKPEVKRSPAKINSFIEKRKERSPVNKSVFSASQARGGYKLPPVDLLQQPKTPSHKNIEANIKHNINVLEETLNDFGIDAKVVNVEHGPTVTLYELEPAAGVKVQKISNLSDDIALVMKAHDVRIEAPIPGKGTVGVEIPNKETSMVTLREIVESEVFQNSKSKLTLGLGKDVSGNIIVSELSEMPHLLIAGATGSGKTVCVNTIVASILFNATPDEVKFIMVDPKMVELVCFNGIAHLLTPIVTDHKKVPVVLNWLVSEMENRYKILAKVAARNISQYNQKVNNGIKSAEGEEFKKLPYLVLIIDELADLMVVAGKEVEEAIGRLAHLSRAVGIHMILATQRPSVDVITGTIKSNFPARISFKVASKVDSRTVLDGNGADKLLGKGDMLFLRPRSSKLLRVQGSLVTDGEIEDMVEFIKNQRQPEYEEDIDIQQEKQVIGRELGSDELYDEAVDIVLRTEQASASMLQRRLRIGYTRAARLIDMMEQEGIVGPHRGSKAREILVNSE